MTTVSGVLEKNLLKLSGTSPEIVEFNHKLAIFSQFLDTVTTKDSRELACLLSEIKLPSNSVSKGIEGESFVENYIDSKISINPNWSIANISKDCSFNSDLELIYKRIHCVIEVKNLKSKVSDSTLKKFREEYIVSESKLYNSGIFVSLNTGFGPSSKVHDFCVSEIEGRFVIYLANVRENPEKLIFAMDVLDQLIDISYNRDVKTVLDILRSQIKNYTCLMSNVNKINATLKEMKKSITDSKDEIIKFLEKN